MTTFFHVNAFFEYGFLRRAMLAGLLMSVTCGLLSPFIVLRRLSFSADGLAHSSLGGLAVGLFVMGNSQVPTLSSYLVSFVFTCGVAVAIAYFSSGNRLQSDTAVGACYVAAFALGILLLSWRNHSTGHLEHFFFGSILAVNPLECWLLAGLAVAAALFCFTRWQGLGQWTFDEELAQASGICVASLRYILMLLIAATVILSTKVVGVLLVTALLILPGAIAGLPQTASERAFDMFLKVRHVQSLNGGGGVVFATGTPIANSMAEMFTMQRYLQHDELKKHNLHHFDSWAATFGEPVTAMELSPDGAGYRLNTRFARFINVPELMQMFRQSADVQTALMLNLPRPKLDGEKPTIRNAPVTEQLKEFVQSLAARAERLKTGRVDPSEDNMLKITSEGRKAALDIRLMKPAAPDEPHGKVNLAVEKIFNIWQESKPERSAQLVFCDLSTPKDRGFSVYNDMARKLERLGVPGPEIAFIQDHDSDASKMTLFRDVRAGKVRVLFGSTQKMGSGTNVQERLIALHHLDAPWRPADVEQREGRILRQGNKNSVVQIFRYVTEGSFDAYMWQTLETKAKFIAQVMSGDMTIRRLEDLDSAALTYAEVKAIASGNPLVIEKAQVDAELIRLTRLRSAHAEEQYRIRSNLRRSHEDAEIFTTRLDNLRQDLGVRQDTSGDKFRIELDEQESNNRGIAGELIIRRAEKLKARFGDDIRIGRFAGFDLFLRPGLNNTTEMVLRGKNSYGARVTDTALGTIRSLEAMVQGFEERAERLELDITDANKRVRELGEKVGAKFEREDRFQELTRRQSEIEEKLDLTKNQASSQVDATSDETQEKAVETQSESMRHTKRSAVRV